MFRSAILGVVLKEQGMNL